MDKKQYIVPQLAAIELRTKFFIAASEKMKVSNTTVVNDNQVFSRRNNSWDDDQY